MINVIKMVNSHLFKRKFIIYSPASVDISRKSNIVVKDKFIINMNWSKKLTINNKRASIIKFDENSQIIVDKFFIYSGANVRVRTDAVLKMGTGYINHNCLIDCKKKIIIGNNVFIGENVIIRDSDNHNILSDDYIMTKDIVINDNVWIGNNAIILKGVSIGKGSIIGAGSIVTKDIPEYCVAVGNPAKVIKKNITWK